MASGLPSRVLHLITPSRMAGAETFLARLLQRRTALRHDLRCAIGGHGSVAHELRGRGIEAAAVAVAGKVNPLALWHLRQAVRHSGAQLLHTHLSSASWWAGWLESLGGPPSIGHVHGFTSAAWHARQSHLVTCSHAVRDDLVHKGLDPQRITVLHCPVEAADVAPRRSVAQVRAELGADPHTRVVGTFAHLSPKKGYRELVQAAATVLAQRPHTQFWICGDGPLRGELTEYLATHGLADRVKLLGFRRDVADLMQGVDVMALPSHREPFGLVYVEAGLLGRPVVACNAGGAPEIIVPGETGLLVPPHQPTVLANALLTLLDNPAECRRLGEQGRERCRTQFTWQRFLGQLDALYDRVTESLPAARQQRAA